MLKLLTQLRSISNTSRTVLTRASHIQKYDQNSTDDPDKDLQILLNEFEPLSLEHPKQKSLTERGSGTVDDEFAPYLMPTFNLAAYANKSKTLQQFIKLGVDLHKIEKRKGLAQFFLQLEFEKDVQNHLLFLKDIGVSPDLFGEFITKNPLIFKEDLDNLQTRINYLEAKHFTKSMITRIVENNPFWLMFSTKRIDRRLGHYQKEFHLNGNQVRELSCKQPRLITYNMAHVIRSTFAVKEEMGFDRQEMRTLVLAKPRIFMLSKFL